jgi:hypothetical protein
MGSQCVPEALIHFRIPGKRELKGMGMGPAKHLEKESAPEPMDKLRVLAQMGD